MKDKTQYMVRADKDLIERINQNMERSGCSSRNDFFLKAIEFYCSFLDSMDDQSFLAAAIKSEMNGIIGKQANRLSQLEFRLAVELDKLSHILASACDIDHDHLEKLHRRCVQEINDTGRFPDARKSVERFRMHGGAWEDDD